MLRVRSWDLWPGTDTTGVSAVGFGCSSPSAAAGPPSRTDPGTPTSGGYGRSPVNQKEGEKKSGVTFYTESDTYKGSMFILNRPENISQFN